LHLRLAAFWLGLLWPRSLVGRLREVFSKDRNRRGTFLDPTFALRSISPACLMNGTLDLTLGLPCCDFYKRLFGIVVQRREVG
jgi:hypothetical protein